MTIGPHASTPEQPRILTLQGGHNFRDLGGYRTADGRSIRWGRIFRSGELNNLTPADYQVLAAIGIRTVLDLRSNRECAVFPVAFPEAMAIDYWKRNYEGSSGDLIALIRRAGTTAEHMREMMLKAYRRLPYEQAPAFRELFHRIANGELPLIFNCVAGKDRTGIAAALLLFALGVPRETIIADYILTERFFEPLRLRLLARAAGLLSEIAPNIWAPIVRTERAYLEAMFVEIENRDGSVEAYMEKSLAADAVLLRQLRLNLLQNGSGT